MTKKEAKKYCLLKWQLNIDAGGFAYNKITAHPVLKHLENYCAYCELYIAEGCRKCPLNINNIKCTNPQHLYDRWRHDSTVQNAQAMYDLIKNN